MNKNIKDHIFEMVKATRHTDLTSEWQQVRANFDDCVAELRSSLSDEQVEMLEVLVMPEVKKMLDLVEEWTFDRTFDEVCRLWRLLLFDEEYLSCIDELIREDEVCE